MRLKTFRAFTLDEALAAIHSDLGHDAAILHTRTYRRGGLLGIGGQEIVEVIASEKEPDLSILPAVTRPREMGGAADEGVETVVDPDAEKAVSDGRTTSSVPAMPSAARARRAYRASAAVPTSSTDAKVGARSSSEEELPARSTSLEVDRDRTRALAKAMEIQLERKKAARAAAGVAGPDDLIGGIGDQSPVDQPETPETERSPVPEAIARPSAPTTESATTFIIGPDGVLLPEESVAEEAASSAAAENAPRVVSLDPVETRPDALTGIPVATVQIDSVSVSESSATVDRPISSVVDDPVEQRSELEEAPAEPCEAGPVAASAMIPTEEGTDEKGRMDVRPPRPWAVPAAPPPGEELEAIGATVQRVLDGEAPRLGLDETGVRPGADHPDPLARAYSELIAQEFSRDLAARVVTSLEASLEPDQRRDPTVVRRAMLAEIADLVPTEESIEAVVPRDGRPRTIAFVGPTGVGKTTTLAKIAATLTLRDGLKVGFVTADTYRISAVDQLRTYADILESRLEVAGDPESMRAALARCADLDAVLIDTPGRSQNDVDSLAELRALMDAARPHETHLVLSGTAAERVLVREAEAFSALGPDRVVLTKLDEAVAFGMLVSVVRRIGRRISWVTTGQEVPRDVERATGNRLADLVLGGAVKS